MSDSCETTPEQRPDETLPPESNPDEMIPLPETARSEIVPETSPKTSWMSRHKDAIQAWSATVTASATVVLAIITGLSLTLTNRSLDLTRESLDEIRAQRDLAYRQFAIANAPSVRAYVNKRFRVEDRHAVLKWDLVNAGGTVHDVTITSIVLCCGPNELGDPSKTKCERQAIKRDRLNRNAEATVSVEVYDPNTIAWLKSANDDFGKLVVYAHIEYTIPAELSIERRQKRDETFALVVWDSRSKMFEDVGVKHHNAPFAQIWS